MELKVGMYVRTDLGIIARLTEVFDFKYKTYYLNFSNAAVNCKQNDVIHNKGKILKASYNPVDLIEPGDYVNGYKVIKIFENQLNKNKLLICLQRNEEYEYSDDLSDYMNDESIHIYNKDIKSIVTHEQFENMKYEIGG